MKIYNTFFLLIPFLYLLFSLSCKSNGVNNGNNNQIDNSNKDKLMKFELNSLEGKTVTVLVKPDYLNNKLAIYLDKADSICFTNFKEFDKDITIYGNHIAFAFSERGGSGVHFKKHLELCISGNKIFCPINLYSYESGTDESVNGQNTDSIQPVSNVVLQKLDLLRLDAIDPNRVFIVQENVRNSNAHKNVASSIADTFALRFDTTKKLFYNKVFDFSGEYKVYNAKGFEMKKFNVGFSGIEIKNRKYVFIEGSWFLMTGLNELTEISNFCN